MPRSHGKAETPCAFAGLFSAMTGAIDPVQIATLIAFVLAAWVTATLLPLPANPHRMRARHCTKR